MQVLFELIPLIAFFVAYKFGAIFVATGVVMVAGVAQAIIRWIMQRQLGPMLLTPGVVLLNRRGLTLTVQHAAYIELEPRMLYWLFSPAFAASHFLREEALLELVLTE